MLPSILTIDTKRQTLQGKLVPQRHYATEEKLMHALEKANLLEVRHLVCKTIEDRWTAVFIGSNNLNRVMGSGFCLIG